METKNKTSLFTLGASMLQDFLWFIEYDISTFTKTLILTQAISLGACVIAYII